MKKGQTSTFMIITIILVVGLIMFSFATAYGKNLKQYSRGDDCNREMILKTMTTFKTGLGLLKYEGVSAACPAYDVSIGTKKTSITKKNKKFTTIKYNELTDDQIYQVFAEELRYCWKEYGAGELDAFWYPDDWLSDQFNVNSDIKGCRICSTIIFENDVLPKTLNNFTGYMKTTEFLSKRGSENEGESDIKTYYSYIAEKPRFCYEKFQGGENCWEEYAEVKKTPELTNPLIETKKTYYTVFVREDMEEGDGTLNAYIMDEFQVDNPRYCNTILPFQEV